MSTSDPLKLDVEGLGSVPGYLPDIKELTRLANEMFSTPPGAEQVSGIPSGIPPGVSTRIPSGTPSGNSYEVPHSATAAPIRESRVHTDPPSRAPYNVPHSAAEAPHPESVAPSGIPFSVAHPTAVTPDPKSPTPSATPLGSYYTVPYSAGTGQALKIPAFVGADLPYADMFAASPLLLPAHLDTPHAFLPSGHNISGVKSAPSAGATVFPVNPVGRSSFYFLDEAIPYGSAARTEQVPQIASIHPAFDANAIRRDFPILKELVNGRPLIWLDNAATTQKPQSVIDRLSYFYQHENSNIHRAAHELAARATDAYEESREKVRRFLNAPSTDEIIFLRGTTEAINLVAQSWGRQNVNEGDEVVITWLEHHANIVPWQALCNEKGAKLRVAPVDDDGQILLDEYQKLLGSRTKLVSFSQVSNALGTVTPAREMIEMAHRVGARVLVDGAQSVSHMRVDVQQLDCDWFVFSGHKVFGPTGIGALFGKIELLNSTPPWQGGGNMIQNVTFEKTDISWGACTFRGWHGQYCRCCGAGGGDRLCGTDRH